MSNSNLVLPALVQKEAAQPKAQVAGIPVLGLSIAEYTGLIKMWAQDRNLIKGSTFAKQSSKLLEEVGEMALHINKGADVDGGNVPDDVGDVAVVLTILCAQAGIDVEQYIIFGENTAKPMSIDGLLAAITLGVSSFAMCQFETNLPKAVQDMGHVLIGTFEMLEEMGKRYNTDLRGCLEVAYNDIKDRKGRMIAGIFVKEKDLPENRAAAV